MGQPHRDDPYRIMTDTHTHLTEEPLISSIDEVIKRAKENGVDKFIVPGYNPDSWLKARKLASVYNEIFFAVGLHPMFTHEENREAFENELKVGGAKIYEKHANIIIGGNDCTAQNVWDISEQMKRAVQEKFDIELQREVRFLGSFQPLEAGSSGT